MPTGNVTVHRCAKRATDLCSKSLDEIRGQFLIIAEDMRNVFLLQVGNDAEVSKLTGNRKLHSLTLEQD